MKEYQRPEILIEKFESENVITDSAAYIVQQTLNADIRGGTGSWNSAWDTSLNELLSIK